LLGYVLEMLSFSYQTCVTRGEQITKYILFYQLVHYFLVFELVHQYIFHSYVHGIENCKIIKYCLKLEIADTAQQV
jgi:hypothetical protein